MDTFRDFKTVLVELNTEMLMKTDTLQDGLEKYRQKIAAGGRNRTAAYELALASVRAYKPGDQISYYIKATPKKVAAYDLNREASRSLIAAPRKAGSASIKSGVGRRDQVLATEHGRERI